MGILPMIFHGQDARATLCGDRFDNQAFAFPDLFAGSNESAPNKRFDFVDEKNFDAAAAWMATRIKASRDHAAVVKNKQIADAQKVADLAKAAVLKSAGRPLDNQQARLVAPLDRMARDPIGRELIVKVFEMDHRRDVLYKATEFAALLGAATKTQKHFSGSESRLSV
jgi:hypothetical protein